MLRQAGSPFGIADTGHHTRRAPEANMPSALLADLVRALSQAHQSGSLLDATAWADAVTTEADAYAVQAGVAAALGWPSRCWKSGGAGPTGPFSHSPLTPHVGTTLLGVEAELALRISRDISPSEAHGARALAPADVVDAMCIAVECIGSRWQQALAAPALLRMADLQSNAGLLLGPWQPYRALAWPQLEWRLAWPGQPVLVRQGGHTLGDPAAVLPAWVRHATREGATVKAGTVVTTGAWGGLHACPAGARGQLSIEGLGDFSFSAAA